MAAKWEYTLAENIQQNGETKAKSIFNAIQSHARNGWEFDQVIHVGDGENVQLLFRKQISN